MKKINLGPLSSMDGARQTQMKIRRRLMLFWILLTFVVFGSVILVLSAAGLLSNADQRIERSLTMRLQDSSSNLQVYMDYLTAQSLKMSRNAARDIEKILEKYQISLSGLNDNPGRLEEIQQALYETVYTVLQISNCSGAYVVLDATANTQLPGSDESRSGLYLKLINLHGGNALEPDISCFRGIPKIARQTSMELHNRWNMEFDIGNFPGYRDLLSQHITRASEYYYWSEKIDLQDTWEKVLLLCVPIVGQNGTIYGICGVEVSTMFFQLGVPVQTMDFGSVFTVLAPLEDGKLMLQKGLVGSNSGMYREQPEGLSIHQGRSFCTYTGNEVKYVGVQQAVNLSQENNACRQWVAALLMPGEQYFAYSSASHQMMMLYCLGILLLLLLVSSFLYWKFLQPFQGETADIWNTVYQRQDVEILMEFLRSSPLTPALGQEGFPEEVNQAMERFLSWAQQLPEDEKQIFRLLVAGCEPKNLPLHTGLRKHVVQKRLHRLCEGLNVSYIDDILFYIDFFRRSGRREQLQNM